MADFTDQIIADARRERQLRRQKMAGHVAQALGGTAETFRTGASAVDTFAKRAPAAGDFMSAREKMERRNALIAKLGPEERAAYDNIVATKIADQRAATAAAGQASAAETARYATSSTNQRLKAQLEAEQYNREEDAAVQGITDTQSMNEDTKALFTSIVGANPPVTADEMETYRENNTWARAQPDSVVAEFIRPRDLSAAAKAIPTNVSQEETGELVALVEAVAAANGTSPDELVAANPALADAYRVDKDATRVTLEAHEREAEYAQEGAKKAAGSTHSSVKPLDKEGGYNPIVTPQASPAPVASGPTLDATARGVAGAAGAAGVGQAAGAFANVAAAAQEVAPDLTAAPAQESALQAEAPEQTQAAPAQPLAQPQPAAPAGSPHTVFGLAAAPVTGTMEKIMQQLDYIEKYPEHPPLQMLREKIMDSQEFKDYAAKHNLDGDLNMAFKEMHRDMRKKQHFKSRESAIGRKTKRMKERGIDQSRIDQMSQRRTARLPKDLSKENELPSTVAGSELE